MRYARRKPPEPLSMPPDITIDSRIINTITIVLIRAFARNIEYHHGYAATMLPPLPRYAIDDTLLCFILITLRT